MKAEALDEFDEIHRTKRNKLGKRLKLVYCILAR